MDNTGTNPVNQTKEDYRGFILVHHAEYGLLLLRCTRKTRKPPHWQLPGGHIDDHEFAATAATDSDHGSQLLQAGKMGSARELFEETGIDVRSQLGRLQPVNLHRESKHGVLSNEFKHRLFFHLNVTDADFTSEGVGAMGTETMLDCPYKHIKVRDI